MRLGARRDDEISRTAQESVARRDSGGATHARDALHRLFHRREIARLELPAADDTGACRAGERAKPQSADGRRARAGRDDEPVVVGVGELLPSPRQARAVDHVARRRREVAADLSGRRWERGVRGIDPESPTGPAVHERRFRGPIALEQEARAPRVLRHGAHACAPVPHERGDHVAASSEPRREIDGLVPPVVHVGALRPGRHLLAVDVEAVSVVGRDVHEESRGPVSELERATCVEHDERVRRHAGRCDPACRWCAGEDARGAGRLRSRARRDREMQNGEHGECADDRTMHVSLSLWGERCGA